MKVVDILGICNKNDIKVSLNGIKLKITSKNKKIPEEIVNLLRTNKEEIITFLSMFKHKKYDAKIESISHLSNFQLSYAQQRLWFLSQYMGPSVVYNMPLAIRLRGQIDTKALLQSLEEIINRHQVLRTRFEAFEDSAIQVVDPVSFNLEIEPVTSQSKLKAIFESERNYLFNLSKDRLCRFRLLLDESEQTESNQVCYVLLVTMHHSVSDGWSLEIFFRELVSLYQAFKHGEASPLPPLPIQYVDYSHWQRQWLQGDVLENQLSYWREQLKDAPPLLTLPTDRPRPMEQSFQGSFESISMSQSLSTRLQNMGRKYGVTMFMTLLSAFSILLARYSGLSDIVVGTPIANREKKETEDLIGFFANTMVMRSDLSKDPSFAELLVQTREVALGGYAHQDIPFEQLVEDLNPERSLSHSPLFQVMFALQNIPVESASLPDLEFEPLVFKGDNENAVSTGVSRFDLTLTLRETSAGIIGGMEYNTDLFDESTIVQMLSHYECLLAAIVEAPETHISKLEFLSEAEKQQQLIEWNSVRVDYPRSRCIHELFEAQVASDPTAIALVYEQKQLSYIELNNRANQLAHYLIAQGVGPQTCVGLCVEDPAEMLVASLGILKTGGACVALDPKSPALRLAYQIEDSGISLIVTRSDVSAAIELHQLSKAEGEQESACGLQFVNLDAEYIGTNEVSNPQCRLNALALACVLYTNSYSNSYSNSYTDSHSGEPKAHGMSHQNISCLLYNDCGEFSSPQSLLCASPISFDVFVFDAWRALLKGEQYKVPTQAIEAYRERIQHVDCQMQPQALGRAVSNNGLFVLNPQGELVAQGVVGELYLSGDSVSLGYLNQASLTAEHFVPDPFNDAEGERLYRSGDRVRYLADGQLEYLGRVQQQAKPKTQAKKLAQDGLTTTLLKLDAVKALAIVEREGQLVCYLVPTEEKIDEKKLFSSVSKHLRSQYSLYLLPEEFIVLAVLPLTDDGRLDSKALPLPAKPSDNANYIAPQTDTEKALVEIWQQKLGLDKIGLEDNYFVLGGDSIRSIALVAEAKKRGMAFSIKDLFAHPTVGALAAEIDMGGLDVTEFVEIVPYALLTEDEHRLLDEEYDEETLEDAFPLSMMQQGMVLLALKQSHLNVYENLQIYHFDDVWDVDLFKRALTHLMNKHPMLKSVYHLSAGRPLQLLFKDMQPNLTIVDLSDQDVVSNQEVINQWMETEKAAGIDTSKELWRATVHLLPEGRFLFGMFLHHAMWDGWSLESFITELYSTYAQLRNSVEVSVYKTLPSYNQFIALEQTAINSTEQQDYWQRKFVGANLPWWTGREKSPSVHIPCDISVATSQKLTALAGSLGVQEKSLWSSVYLVLLALLNGSDKVVGPVLTQGRPEIPDGDKMVGVFLNALPLHIGVTGKSWADFIKATDRELREQHGFRNYPLAEIQRSTGLDFSGAILNYTNWHVYYEEEKSQTNSSGQAQDLQGTKNKTQAPHKVGGWADTNYLLLLDITKDERTQQFVLNISADSTVFDEAFRARIQGYVANIIDQLATQPNDLINKTGLLGAEETAHLLVDLNATNKALPKDLCIHQLFEAQVAKYPDAIALTYEEAQLSYGELNRRSNQLAHYLIAQGVTADVRVGICVNRSVEMMIALLGILKAGGCYVPLDPQYPKERLAHVIENSGIELIVTQSSVQSSLDLTKTLDVRCVFIDSSGANCYLGAASANPSVSLHPSNLAYVIYTSGSTGAPKGVRIPHRNVVNFLSSMQRQPGMTSNDRLLAVTTLSFDIALLELYLPLTVGANVEIASQNCVVSGAQMSRRVEQSQITLLQATPVTWKLLLESGWQGKADLNALVGGEAVPKTLVNELLPRVRSLWNMYGPTETTVWSTLQPLTSKEGTVAIGKPIDNTDVYVLDRQQQLCPIGVPGELYLGGAGLSQGYFGQTGLTAERFVPHPFSKNPGELLYRTGDLVQYLTDGSLDYIGRFDHQVKVRGYRIELGEIESVLLQHRQVKDVVVVVREDEVDDQRIVAYVVSQVNNDEISQNEEIQGWADPDSLINELRSNAQKQLPHYMLPSAIVMLETLPLTANKKVDRGALPVPDMSSQQVAYLAPEGVTEELLAVLWGESLQCDRVGRQDDFFALGGHSLLATQLLSRIRKAFAVEMPIRLLFEHHTLQAQAKVIAELQQGEAFELLPMELVSREAPILLSYAQQRLWFLSQYMGPNAVYNMPLALRLTGEVDVDALLQSLQEIVLRHEILRTRFEASGDSVVQIIEPPLFSLSVEPVTCATKLKEICQHERSYPFNLSRDKLCRMRLLLDESDENISSYVLLVTMHHSISDGWSLGIFFKELLALYQAFKQNEPSPLAPIPIQYADYAHWQRQWLQGEVLEGQLSYWGNQLKGLPPLLTLPTDRPRPPEQSFNGSSQSIVLSKTLSTRLQQLSRAQGVTVYMSLLSAFSVLLSRYSGQDDIAIGSPIANRTRQETEGLIGFFVNTLVMRSDLRDNPSFVALLKQIREVALQGYAHQDVPFEQLVEELSPERSLSHSPLFQVMFTLQNIPIDSATLSDLELAPLVFEETNEVQEAGVSRFDLWLTLQETPQGIAGSMEYNTDLFDRTTIVRMLSHYERLLEAIIESPDVSVLQLDFLSEAEKQQQLVQWNSNAAQVDCPIKQCIHELFEAHVVSNPTATALVFDEQQVSYFELNRRANQLSHYLIKQGVGPDVPVGICLNRGIDMIIAILGVLKAGGAYVPIDPSYPSDRLSYLLSDSRVEILLSQIDLETQFTPTHQRLFLLDSENFRGLMSKQPETNICKESIGLKPENLSYLIYTSGSTGQPKGVMGLHLSIVNRVNWLKRTVGLTASDVLCQKTSVGFVDHVAEIFQALTSGVPLVILSTELLQSPDLLMKELNRHQITQITLVPSVLKVLLESENGAEVPQLRAIYCSGETLNLSGFESFSQRFPNSRLFNIYGSTEIGADVSAHEIDFKAVELVDESRSLIGKTIDNTESYILSAQGELVPLGVVGELYIGGLGLARGYFVRAGFTAEKFVPHPFSQTPGERLYRTGDLVRYTSAGELDYLGRIDHQVKIRGFRIELSEIESVILQHHQIKGVVVLAREDEIDNKRLVAYVVAKQKEENVTNLYQQDKRQLNNELRAYLQSKLPAHMVPSVIVELSSFPLNTSGKVDRGALPVPDRTAQDEGYVAPDGVTEELLASLWCGVLGCSQVSRFDNFFTLGGHSLLVTQLVSRIRETFSVEMTIRELFEQQTLNIQAQAIEQSKQSQGSEIVSIKKASRQQPLMVSFAQQRLWFLSRYMGPNSVYNMSLTLRLSGKVNENALINSLEEIVSRHEALRTRFEAFEDSAIQIIDPPSLALSVEPVTSEISLKAICQSEGSFQFDLSKHRLCRVRLLRDESDENKSNYVLLVTMHHSVSDGWSMGVFFKELVSIYQAFNQGEASPLAPLPIQYADYAQWQRHWLQGEVLENQLTYWRQQLEGLPQLLTLPTDRPRPEEQTFNGSTQSILLSEALSNKLQGLSQNHGVTLYMTLLSAFSVLMSRYSGQDDVAIGTPIANRTRKETEGLIGFFVNTMVMRSDLSQDPSFVMLLKQTREVALQGYANQDIPFEQLVEELNPERSLSHSPLFQVMFSLQNIPVDSASVSELEIGPLVFKNEESNGREEGLSHFDLTLTMRQTPKGLVGDLEYNTDLFDQVTIERMLGHYERLLAAIVDTPQTSVFRLEFLSEGEKEQQLIEWNATQIDYPKERCIHILFEAQVAKDPDAIALVCEEKQMSYGELNCRANQLAHHLIEQGVNSQTRVGLLVDDPTQKLIGTLGILKASGTCVPLAPQTPALRLAYQFEDSSIGLIVTHSAVSGSIDSIEINQLMSEQTSGQFMQVINLDERTLWSNETCNLQRPLNALALACVIYTTSHNGAPQAHGMSHQSLSCLFHSDSGEFSSPRSLLCAGPIAFDVFVFDALRALLKGEQYRTPAQAIQSYREHIQNLDCRTQPQIIGRALSNNSVFVLDSQGELVPQGVVGELYLSGDSLSQSYLNQAGLTAEHFIPDPFNGNVGARLYRSGDRVRYLPDGKLEYFGRIESQPKAAGLRLAHDELTTALLQLDGVKEAAIIQNDSQLVCYFVPKEGRIETASLSKHLRSQSQLYPMPAEFVMLDALPLTANGRLDHKALPAQITQENVRSYVAPQSNTEKMLVAIWQQKLGLDKIGIEDNYFVLGGDSIRSIALVAEAKKQGLEFSIKDLFAHPTVSALAAALDQGGVDATQFVEIAPFALLSEEEQDLLNEQYEEGELEDAFPLSMMQQGMVLLALKQSHLNVYENLQIYHFNDIWDGSLFEQALTHLMNKHPMLKSVYHLSAGRPLQLLFKEYQPNLTIVDLSQHDEGSIQKSISQWMQTEKAAGIDTSQELWRATVHILPEGRFAFGMFIHHALWDGWSLESFITELYSTYAQLRQHSGLSAYEALPSYNQFIVLEQAALTSPKQEKYWMDKLDEVNLPWWTGREKSPSAHISFDISEDTSQKLTALAARLGVQEKSLWCSVYLTLLALLDGSEKVAGPVATQGRPEIPGGDKMVGVFLNVLPVQISVAGKSWADYIQAIDQELREQHGFRHYPLPEMQRKTNLDFSGTLFNYTNWHVYYEGKSENRSHQAEFDDGVDNETSNDTGFDNKVPLKVAGWAETNYLLLVYAFKDEKTKQFGLTISADTGVFDEAFRARIQGYVVNIIHQLETNANKLIDKTSLLAEEELGQLLDEWNDTAMQYPDNQCIHQLFETQAAKYPDAIALVHQGNGAEQMLSYGELNRRSNQLAHLLIEQGVGLEVRVGICVERSVEMVIGILGILKAGGCYVPVDPAHPQKRIAYLIEDSGVKLIVTQSSLSKTFELIEERKEGIKYVYLDHGLQDRSAINPVNQSSSSNLAYVIYTSGSTGAPKGVLISHENIVSLVATENAVKIGKTDVVAQLSNYSFDAITYEMWGGLVNGARLLIIDKETSLEPVKLAREIRNHGVSTLFITTALFNRISQEEPACFSMINQVLFGGEAYSAEAIETVLSSGPNHLIHVYGPTETTTFATSFELMKEAFLLSQSAPIGAPLSNKNAYVMTGNDLAPIGVVGELSIGGDGLSRGYLNQASLTAERFVPNPFGQTPGERLYKTGDLVRYSVGGELEFIGRIDQQVKIRGFRIELGEIEALLLQHHQVKDVVVLAREDEPGHKTLVAYAVAKQIEQLEEYESDKGVIDSGKLANELREYAEAELPSYMIPSAFVILDSLTLTSNGKVDRAALPAPDLSVQQAGYVAPEGVTEELLANIWSDILKLDRIGMFDNFFELGGHSLLATQMLSRIRASFSVELPISVLFELQTVRTQAQAIVKAKLGEEYEYIPMARAPQDKPILLSYAQQRLWFLSRYMGPSAVYNMPLALRLKGEVDEDALLRSLEEIFNRHEALRTRFEPYEDSAIQIIDPPSLTLEAESVSSEAELMSITQFEINYQFDLTQDSLCRLRLLLDKSENNSENNGSYVLLVTMHHSVSDGWSTGIFFKELVALYQAFKQGKESPLAPLALQYADYAHWQREWLQGEILEKQMSYWRDQLEGLPPLLTLPTDRPRPQEQTYNGSSQPIRLPKALSDSLQELSREHVATLFMTLLSAFSVLMSRYSGQDDVAIGTPIANRTRQETEGLIGFFVNTMVMRSDLSQDPSMVELLNLTREMTLQGYSHQDVPFEQLVEELRPERNISYSPLFQVMFALQNVPMDSAFLPELELGPLVFNNENANAIEQGVSRFDLTLSLQETPEGIVGSMEYNTDLFDQITIERMLGHYERLLAAIVEAPKTPVSRLEFLSEGEKEQQLIEWNAAEMDYPKERCIHLLFEAQVDKDSDAIALVCEEKELSYGELNCHANQLAHYLIEQGVDSQTNVGLLVDNPVQQLIGTLGILKASGTCVPLAPQTPALRLAYQFEDSSIGFIVTQSAFSGLIGSIEISQLMSEQTSGHPVQVINLDERTHWSNETCNPKRPLNALALACVMYTTSHNGVPQAQGMSHQSISCLLHSHSGGFSSPRSLLCAAPIAFDVFVFDALRALFKGEQYQTPAQAIQPYREHIQNLDCRTQPQIIGRALSNNGVFVLDSQGELVPQGVVGELYLSGDSLSQSYLNQASLTAEHFIPDAFNGTAGARLYRSGDRARYLPDGKLEYLGRVETPPNAAVRRLAQDELTAALLQFDEVKEAVIIQNDGQLVCYFVPKEGSIEAASLSKHLRSQSQLYPMPAVFVMLDALPLTANGRLDHKALPAPIMQEEVRPYVAPQSETEKTLVAIWQQKLGLEKIGIEDNYFVLGGDSIRSIALVAEAKKQGVVFSIKDLFAHPTVSALAAALEQGAVEATEFAEIAPFALLTDEEQDLLNEKYEEGELEDAFPLSMMQEGMVLLALKQSHLNVYENLQIYYFDDVWNGSLFEQALTHLMNKHPMLKSVYHLSAGRPLQLLLKDNLPNMTIVDLSQQDDVSIHESISQWMQTEKAAGIDTSQELWRTTVHLLPGDRFAFGMCVHHALWDGWSLESFVTELYSTYAQLRERGGVSAYEALPSYNQFIALEQAAIASPKQQSYWMDKLAEANLPWWAGREKSPSANISCDISEATSQRLTALAASLGVQEKSLWCSVYLILLALLDGSDKVAGCIATQGRPEIPGGDKMVGVFLNALPLCVAMKGERWADFIQATDSELRGQHAFRHYPLAEMQRASGLDFSGALFNYTNWHVYYEGVQQEGSEEISHELAHEDGLNDTSGDAQVPLKLGGFSDTNYLLLLDAFKDEKTQRFGVNISIDTMAFDESLRQRIEGYVTNIIHQIEFNTNSLIDKSDLLGAEEIKQLLANSNDKAQSYPVDKCIHELFELQVEKNPDATALVYENEQLSYDELNRRSNQLAHYLISQGVGPDVRVGICVERSIEMLVGILGILKSGGAYVPIDPNYPIERIAFQLEDSGAEIVLSQSNLATQLSAVCSANNLPLIWLDRECDACGNNNILSDQPVTNIDKEQIKLTPASLAYVIYTSGSTGTPKGVLIEHCNITRLFYATASDFNFGQNDVWTLFHSYAFDFSVWEIWGALSYGGSLVIVPSDVTRSPVDFYKLLVSEGVTILNQTPTMFNQLISVDANKQEALSLRTVIFGGEALELQHLKPWFELHDDEEIQLVNMYGITETTVHVTYRRLYQADLKATSGSIIGKPLADLELYLLDNGLSLVPSGVSAEIFVGGAGVARGYLNREDLTNSRFIDNPFKSGERLYRTGDLGRYLPNGDLEYMGRIDNQVKIRGFRIELGEIEGILQQHSQVKDVVVLAKEDEPGNKRLVAYIVKKQNKDHLDSVGTESGEFVDSTVLTSELRISAQTKLPAYMVPSAIVLLDAMPLTSNGKADHKALLIHELSGQQCEYIAPTNEIEQKLCQHWQTLFKVERVGIHDNFWTLGGHSLLAIRLSNFIQQEFDVELSMKSMFENQNIEEFADLIVMEKEFDYMKLKESEFLSTESDENIEEGSF